MERISAVDLEQQRLSAVVRAVWECPAGHYHYACECDSCQRTRETILPHDLTFVDFLSRCLDGTNYQIGRLAATDGPLKQCSSCGQYRAVQDWTDGKWCPNCGVQETKIVQSGP